MDILGYEIDIYLVIVALAGILVLSIMLLIGNSMKGKRTSPKKSKGERKQRAERGELSETQLAKDESKPQQPEKSLSASPDKPSKELQKPSITVTPNEISALLVKGTTDADKSAPAGTDIEKKVTADNEVTKSIPAGPDTEKSAVPMARLWDTEATQGAKEVSKGDVEGKEKDGGLLDVFADEDVEDNGLAELAGLLVDVDVDTLRKLSSEVSHILARREKGSQRRR